MADKSEEVAHLQEEHSEQGIADATEQVNVDLPNDCHSPPPAYSAAEVKVKVNDNEGGENDVNGGDGGDSGHQTLVTKPPITSTSAFYIKKWILLTMISLTILLLLLTIFLAELILPAIDAESCQTNTEDCSMETDKDNKDFRLAARTFLFLLLKLHVFFLWGVARHRLCPSTTYTVLNVLVSFGLGFACVAMPTTSMIRNALVAAALTAVAYSYTKDLRKNMRDSCTTVVLRRLDAVNVNVSEGENGGSRQAVLHPKPPPPATTAFLVKKWILLVTMTIGFLCLLIVLLALGYILERVPSPSPEEDSDDAYCQLVGCSKAKVDIKKAFKIVLCAILLLALLLQGLFIWGVARQHLGLCVGYTVLCVLTTCSMLISSLDDPAAKLLRAPVPLLLTYVAYSYTNDLRIMRNNRLQRGLAVV